MNRETGAISCSHQPMEHDNTDNIISIKPEYERFFRMRQAVEHCFEVDSFNILSGSIRVTFHALRVEKQEIQRIFNGLGYHAYIKTDDSRRICVLVEKGYGTGEEERKELRKAIFLFFATLVSTVFVGYYHSLEAMKHGVLKNPYTGSLSFSFTLLLILGAHELGHKWAAAKNGIASSPPYFLPFPSLIGTLGAVIRVKSPMPNANAAVTMGVSGPLAGFVFAAPAVLIGALLSKAVPMQSYLPGDTETVLGSSLLMKIVYSVAGPAAEPGYVVNLHPVAIAAWAGIMVTSLNLIPIGQLDGGHILRALAGEKAHLFISRCLIVLMFAVGAPGMLAAFGRMGSMNDYAYSHFWSGWLIWSILGVLVVKRKYPKYLWMDEKPNSTAWLWGLAALAIFILSFIPMPVQVYEFVTR